MSDDSDGPIAAEVLPPAAEPSSADVERPLRVWPVFAVFAAIAAACIVAQIPVVVAFVLIQVAGGASVPQAMEGLGTVWGFVAVALPAQLVMLGGWWLAISYGDPRARLFRPIGTTSLPWPAYPCFAWATLAVLWLGALLGELAVRLLGNWDSGMFAEMYKTITWPSGIVLVLFIALVPGLVEELFFRGYMQRRLLARLSPGLAIPIVAIVFAGFHGTPVWALTVLPLALWFGILAWRTGSLWPGIVCHAFINGSVNFYRVGAALDVLPPSVSEITYGLILASAWACLALSAWLLYRYRADERLPAITPG